METKTKRNENRAEQAHSPAGHAPPKAATPDYPFFNLQRSAGNQAMLRLFSKDRVSSTAPGFASSTPEGKADSRALARPSAAQDAEATVRRSCSCNSKNGAGKCAACNEEERLQRSSKNGPTGEPVPSIVHEVLRSSGQPLDEGARSFMASRFGRDFHDVRVCTDEKAAQAADAIHARAFTWANRVVFGRNEYNPRSSSGLRLIAHELAHTAQQSGGPKALQTNLRMGSVDDPQEREADLAADAVLRAQPMPSLNAGGQTVRRQPKDKVPWEFTGDNEGVYTSPDGTKYKVIRSFKKVTKSEPTHVTPGAKFAKAFVTITWCKNGVRGEIETGVDITNQLQQLLPQILATGNPTQVFEQAKLTPYIQAVILPSKKGPITINIAGDVSKQGGLGAIRAGGTGETGIGKVEVSGDVLLGPGGKPVGGGATVTLRPGPPKKHKEVKCDTTSFEAVYECRKEVKVPPWDPTIKVPVPWPPRTRQLYFDYAKDIVTSSATAYGKAHPEIVARNKATIDALKKDFSEDYKVSSITGYTSPEGPMDPQDKTKSGFEGNIMLSEERAKAALEYVAGQPSCGALSMRGCFVKDKDSVTLSRGGELHTGKKDGKELEGKELAEHAVPEFMKKEGGSLTEKEKQALERSRSALSKTEVVYPILRRADILLVKKMTKEPLTFHFEGETKMDPVKCPDDVLTEAKSQFELRDALTGKHGP